LPLYSERGFDQTTAAEIAANPELRERELAKLADYAVAVAATLRQRGVGELQATLAAGTGMSVLRVAIERWANSDDDQSLPVIMKASMAELRAVTAGS
jgi:stage V sporulation protein SpoVS